MKCIYHPHYHLALPAAHPFPVSKYALLRDRLVASRLIGDEDWLTPEELDLATAGLVHTPAYLHQLECGQLTPAEERRLGFRWSPALFTRARLAASGTLLATRIALEEGLAANLAGGTHHAFADHGEGYCLLNDVAIALTRLRADGAIERALIVDLDVHQGNGTAAIFANTPEVFTFSMHGERNYPHPKVHSDLDVGLPDGAGDETYLALLRTHLAEALARAQPQLVVYVAGVDVVAGDRFGKLALSEGGLRARDAFVIESVRERDVALAIVLGGGYAPTRERTAELHAIAFHEAIRYERRGAD